MADRVKTTSAKNPNAAQSPHKPWGRITLDACGLLLWVAVSVIGSQIIVGNIMLWILGAETLSQPVWMAVYSALAYTLAMLLVIFVPPKITAVWRIVNEKKAGKKLTSSRIAPRAVGRQSLGLGGWPTWTDIGLAPVGFIVYLVLAAAITMLFSLFPWFDVEEVQELGFSFGLGGVDRVVAFVTLVVVAPIAEEVIFRGWLYGKLRTKLSAKMSNISGMVISILLVSVLFGLVHGQWNVGVNVFALSVILCGLREITGTIYAGILLHMLKNGVAFYVLYVLGVG